MNFNMPFFEYFFFRECDFCMMVNNNACNVTYMEVQPRKPTISSAA